MKIKTFLIAACLTAATFFTFDAAAQKAPSTDSLLNKRAQNVHFELLGPGGLYSFNYDTRFNKRQDGLGGRIGLSYYSENGDHLFTIPVALNYLLGKKGKYFEVGAGVTYYNVNSDVIFFEPNYNYSYNSNGTYNYSRSNDSGVIGTLNFGYRYQPLDGGFSFRAGVSPVISSDGFFPYWPYLSFGYTF